eukprot:248764_1
MLLKIGQGKCVLFNLITIIIGTTWILPTQYHHSVFVLSMFQLSICYSLTTFQYNGSNPAPSTIICGAQEDCHIICSTSSVCRNRKFYFYNNNITVDCIGKTACADSNIYNINATSLQVYAKGSWAFAAVALYSYTDNQNVNIDCTNVQYSCQQSSFYFLANKQNANIICKGTRGCGKTIISAVQAKTLTVHCHQSACYNTAIYGPVSDKTTIYSYTDQVTDVLIYSIYGNVEIICQNECTNINNFHIIYGPDFSNICNASDVQCIQLIHDTNSKTIIQ